MDVAGVVLVTGSGSPATAGVPMALRPLDGLPLVAHAVRALHESQAVDQVLVVAPPGAVDEVRAALAALRPGRHRVVVGAGDWHESLHRGLLALDPSVEVVVVHDACRPLAPADLAVRVVEAVRGGADVAVPVLEVTETVKELDASGWITRTVPRETLVRVQTPQAVRRTVLDAAHRECGPGGPADGRRLAGEDARAVTVDGDGDAFPVVREHDLELAAAVLAARRVPGSTASPSDPAQSMR